MILDRSFDMILIGGKRPFRMYSKNETLYIILKSFENSVLAYRFVHMIRTYINVLFYS